MTGRAALPDRRRALRHLRQRRVADPAAELLGEVVGLADRRPDEDRVALLGGACLKLDPLESAAAAHERADRPLAHAHAGALEAGAFVGEAARPVGAEDDVRAPARDDRPREPHAGGAGGKDRHGEVADLPAVRTTGSAAPTPPQLCEPGDVGVLVAQPVRREHGVGREASRTGFRRAWPSTVG